ncbi:DUF2087 domain-containing protein [Levilactobacillus tangyuanensis]|uniref:DUF2087 domain-containing protein n=1 Tax=Levilactobacillus tangyuanensis TaxID=2486021 RepID=A0ABW1TLT0_9LACO|nr:DUF2087 domain-containing protein [Levilactobacillus tangyuanensis]
MSSLERSLTEIEQGWHQTDTDYVCHYCDTVFAKDEVFPVEGKFYPAAEMIRQHVAQAHPDAINDLIQTDSKYNTLTTKQRSLLMAFARGEKDATIAGETGVAAATVRHQKFTFREKAKQAKLYLAIYERVFNQTPVPDALVDLPEQTGPVDDRFAITTTEFQTIVQKYFISTDPLRLKRWPKSQKAILAVLKQVMSLIPVDRHYTERDLTAVLKPVYADYPMLRRYLIDYDFLQRKADGSDYWRNPDYKE